VRASGRGRARAEILQRARIQEAIVGVVAERGFAETSVRLVVERAKVSPRTFYELFDGLDDCFMAAIDEAAGRAGALITHAYGRESFWRDGLRAALTSLLVFFDSEPLLAQVCLVDVLAAGSWALERRERNVSELTSLILSRWEIPSGFETPTLAAEGVMSSILGVLHAHVLTGKREPLISLLGPLMGMIMRPYLDPPAVMREIERGETLAGEIQSGRRAWPLPGVAGAVAEIPPLLANPRAHRARRCLAYVSEHAGAGNSEIATGIGVRHQGQVSALLSRLERLDLLVKQPGAPGRPNAWQLTRFGQRVAMALDDNDPSR
jgi:AcrR family transcriptional regulator